VGGERAKKDEKRKRKWNTIKGEELNPL